MVVLFYSLDGVLRTGPSLRLNRCDVQCRSLVILDLYNLNKYVRGLWLVHLVVPELQRYSTMPTPHTGNSIVRCYSDISESKIFESTYCVQYLILCRLRYIGKVLSDNSLRGSSVHTFSPDLFSDRTRTRPQCRKLLGKTRSI
jgi:hypothetical protein